MNVIYSNHAIEKIVERKISKSTIEYSLKNPEIVYKAEKKTCVVISASYTHPERYERKNENNL